MPIIRYQTGEILTPKMVKAEIQAIKGWTTQQYQREYDKFRNKVRNYETITGQKGKYNVQELLYERTRAQKKYGANYRPSKLLREIDKTTSASPGRVKRTEEGAVKGVSKKSISAQLDRIKGDFKGLIDSDFEGVADKIKDVDDPAQVLDILKSAADDLKTLKEAEAKKSGIGGDYRSIGTP